jgi:hypothetical protein
MQTGDVIFLKHHGILGFLITLFDHGKYSHVCIAVSDTEILETDIFTNARIIPFEYKNYDIIRLNLSDEQRNEIPEIAKKLVGIKYDYLLILWYMLRGIFNLKKPWRLPKHEICSELTDLVLYDIGVIPELEYLSGETPNVMYEKIKLLAISSTLKNYSLLNCDKMI